MFGFVADEATGFPGASACFGGGVDTAGATDVGAGAGACGAGAGVGAGVELPMLREIVGGGRGASVTSGRSMGGGRGACGCEGGRKPWPGTKLKAFALSLLIVPTRRKDE